MIEQKLVRTDITSVQRGCYDLFTVHKKYCLGVAHSHTYVCVYPISRHTVVCRAAQEAGAPHREYIYRKKENVIFTLLYLGDSLSD